MLNRVLHALTRVFGSKQQRDLKQLQPGLALVNAVEPLVNDLPDAELQARARALRTEIARALDPEAEAGYDAGAYRARLLGDCAAAEERWRGTTAAGIEAAVARFRARLREQARAYRETFPEDAVSAVLLGPFREDRIERAVQDYAARLEGWRTAAPAPEGWRSAGFDLLLAPGAKPDPLAIFLPEAFALARAAAQRVIGLRHYDVQVIGGTVLHQGKIAEMKTGEGKTLVAVLPVFLNALAGGGVHLITVNDYLAKRDAFWMGQVYSFLGLSVGVIQHAASLRLVPAPALPVAAFAPASRREVYAADVTFGTNSEFGFDYLRDNMAVRIQDCVQRGVFHYAIVDEVDSILVDEARTPLIISGPSEDDPDRYRQAEEISRTLRAGDDFEIDEKEHTVNISDRGIKTIEGRLGIANLYEPAQMSRLHDCIQALRSHHLYKRDVDYLVSPDGKVVIVDQFTGRQMPGRRFSDGLHQALEAKERVAVESENQTLATITLQNYFRMYAKLAGMTGTADTEALEFREIYKLDVVVIPTHHPMVRADLDDAIYRTQREKYDAIVQRIAAIHAGGAPILVGTISIEVSELLSKRLRAVNIVHNVLNAKYHEREAEIIARAGQYGAVTIATNMAGRGTDIVLGERVVEAGGLHILGTERHESRRIDNQLRGRSGRQGDPGESQFYVALDDDLMRLFGSDKVSGIMQKLGMEDGEMISHPFISRALARAQRKVEERNFEIRKNLIKFDDVMNQQRTIVYSERRQALERDEIGEVIAAFRDEAVEALAGYYCPTDKHLEDFDWDGLTRGLRNVFNLSGFERGRLPAGETIGAALSTLVARLYAEREAKIGPPILRGLEKMILLRVVDERWKEHLRQMDHLREGIGLRAYAQKDPFVEYKNESARLFNRMIESVREETLQFLFRVEAVGLPPPLTGPAPPRGMSFERGPWRGFAASAGELAAAARAAEAETGARRARPPVEPPGPKLQPVKRALPKVGRNEPCPCGSGKKYKHCHGQ